MMSVDRHLRAARSGTMERNVRDILYRAWLYLYFKGVDAKYCCNCSNR